MVVEIPICIYFLPDQSLLSYPSYSFYLSSIIKACTRVLFHSHPLGRLEQVDAR